MTLEFVEATMKSIYILFIGIGALVGSHHKQATHSKPYAIILYVMHIARSEHCFTITKFEERLCLGNKLTCVKRIVLPQVI